MKKTPHFMSYKMFHLYVFIIFIQIFNCSLNNLYSYEKGFFNNLKLSHLYIFENYFFSNYTSEDEVSNDPEKFDLENKLDDYHKPLDYNSILENSLGISKHSIKLCTFYIFSFHPEIIPPPPKA